MKCNKNVIYFEKGVAIFCNLCYNTGVIDSEAVYSADLERSKIPVKKFLTFILATALVLSLVPFGVIPVSAESEFVASDEMIQVLKKWEGFSLRPYWDYKQWTVGYGTRVPEGKLAEYQANGIPEDEAEALLAGFLETMGKSVNSFADKFGLQLTQAQFDALLSLSYNCGTSWLYKPSTLRTAIVEGWTGDDLIFALAQWSNMGDETVTGLIRRRLAEADMYLNGNYTVSPPQEYGYVLFDPNGGECEIKVQGYILAAEPEIRALPTYENYTFQGWYTDPTGGEKVTKLDAGLKNYTLYAHWSAGSDGTQETPQEITGTPVSYEKQVATGTLNSFQQPVQGALVVDAYPNGEVLKITAEYTDASGIRWGQVSGEGWINLAYTQDFVETEEDEGPGIQVTVTATDVNLRRGPSTSYSIIGKAQPGDVLEITRTAKGGGYFWGKSSEGWIVLAYTDYDTVVNGEEQEDTQPTEPSEPTEPEKTPEKEQEPVIATGVVTVQSGRLNIRTGPSTAYEAVDYTYNGLSVEIYEIKTTGASKWGRIDEGWICLDYVKLAETQEEEKPAEKPEEEKPEEKPEEEKPQEKPEEEKPQEKPKEEKPQQSVTGRILLSSGRLNIRSGPGSSYSVVDWYTAGTVVTVTEQTTVNGTTWGKTDKGWISMKYVSLDVAENRDETHVTGIVSAGGSKLRVRTGPGSGYSIAGYLADGSTVEILERQSVNGVTWGRTEKGWISMTYVQLKAQEPEKAPETPKEPEQSQDSFTGTVKATMLYIRSGAGTGNKIVGSLYNGESVKILETKEAADGTQWGRIEAGWVCMDYIVR